MLCLSVDYCVNETTCNNVTWLRFHKLCVELVVKFNLVKLKVDSYSRPY